MVSNRKGREFALQKLYVLEVGQVDDELGEEKIITDLKVDHRSRTYGKKLIQLIQDNLFEIDDAISKYSNNWNLDRIAILDKIILRCSMAELKYLPEIPARVSITEAVQLAKKYSTAESPGFVNGVLNAAYQKINSTL